MNKSFLFVGDISSSVEQVYVEKYNNKLDCDVLKISHHGSFSSTSEVFLQATTPEYAVISVGEGNIYGHPSFDVLDRLNDVDANILRTDKHKDILFVVGKYYTLEQLNGIYYISNLTLSYVELVIFIDGVLFVCGIIILIKKNKKNKK